MIGNILKRLFGSSNDRIIRGLTPGVKKINDLEPKMKNMTDEELRAQTGLFRDRLEKGETLDDLLPEAFATVREASRRVLGMRPFDVQLMGGMILHRGMITEMMTGEGKTLVATLPTYLNALQGKGVHVVTVNDYLAQRDSSWMGQLYTFLGLTVGCIVNAMGDHERQQAYGADITYGTNNEFGFDYLRDNMKFRRSDMVQRGFHYAVVDEVDSILIDEARTPLIISGPAEDSSDMYIKANEVIPKLVPSDYEKDEKSRSVTLTEAGSQKIEDFLQESGMLNGGNLYDIHNISLVHHVNQALKAHILFQRDVDYIVKDQKVIIIDEFTGRMMDGRRYSDGLHQALEAKESVPIQMENQTLASVTFQNYFRLYKKLSGMTGTAMTEAAEFGDIYKLEVVQVPTNLPLARQDNDDEVYRTAREKYDAIIALIKECQERQQPALVGTTSIEKSELISQLLKKAGVKHQVLNARYHEQEAYIVAQAGAPGAVTVATNMAGRGTDIKLGGNVDMRLEQELKTVEDPVQRAKEEKRIRQEVKDNEKKVRDAGGLYVIATERHESRRIDNQLRGRSGRQGDPGASKFFLSLEDDLMRIFGSERLDNMLQKLGLEEGEAIVHRWINKALQRAQERVEARNFEIRKHLLKYDDVMNDQRKVIYGQRIEFMDTDDASEAIAEMRDDVVDRMVATAMPQGTYSDDWNMAFLHQECLGNLNLDLPVQLWAEEEGIGDQDMRQRILDAHTTMMKEKEEKFGSDTMRMAEKSILLRVLDQSWKEHLLALDHLRQGINLRAYGQRDPLNEYKAEAFNLFHEMLNKVRDHTLSALSHLQMDQQTDPSSFDDIFDDVSIDEDQLQRISADIQHFLSQENPEEALRAIEEKIKGLNQEKVASSSKKAKKEPVQKKPGSKDSKKDAKAPLKAKDLEKETPKGDDQGPRLDKKKFVEQVDVSLGTIKPPASRMAACPCGSGRRYKHCHGQL